MSVRGRTTCSVTVPLIVRMCYVAMRYGIFYSNHTTHDPTAAVSTAGGGQVVRADYGRWLHLGGKSIFKNSEAVLHAWLNHPDLPHLWVATLYLLPLLPLLSCSLAGHLPVF